MDPGEQPYVHQNLTQVEEILIARVNPILQFAHHRGGQYQYSGHTSTSPKTSLLLPNTYLRWFMN